MYIPPSGSDLLGDAIFCVLANGLVLGIARHRTQRAIGAFRWLFYVPAAPLVWVVCRLCWAWRIDAGAHPWWPVELGLTALPCAALWAALVWAERRAAKPA